MPAPRPQARRAATPSARVVAIRVLQDVLGTGGFSNRWLSHHLERHPDLDPRDRGLTTTLVYGVLRHLRRLDVHIDAHASRPHRLRGEVRQTLRIAAYEQLELRRPPAIAISEARRYLRRLDRSGHLQSAAQAILSGIERDGSELDARLENASPLDHLEKRWSIPRWLAGRWIAGLGPDRALARARVLAEPPSVDLRIDLTRISASEVEARLGDEAPHAAVERIPDQPQALRLRGGGDVFYGPLHDAGLVSVQGLGAQQAALRLEPRPGERILDGCAGMGVKTLQLAELMDRRGTLIAADADERQLSAMHDLIRRGHLDGPNLDLRTHTGDLREADPVLDERPFDRILLDVPCTGLGNLARHPEIRWRRTYEDIGSRTALQRALLTRSLSRLAEGGRLVYAACSIEPEEGAAIVRDHGRADVELEDERTWTPEDDRTEGFFVAALRRRGGSSRSG